MKAAVIHAPRDLRIDEIAHPTTGPGEVMVRIRAGGICGSDLHYYQDGGFGTVRIREPMILGHEMAGEVVEIGTGVTGLAVGDRVAVNPSRPCGHCRYCLEGVPQHCLDMRFYGSAMRVRHQAVAIGYCHALGRKISGSSHDLFKTARKAEEQGRRGGCVVQQATSDGSVSDRTIEVGRVKRHYR